LSVLGEDDSVRRDFNDLRSRWECVSFSIFGAVDKDEALRGVVAEHVQLKLEVGHHDALCGELGRRRQLC
jgi:hypothetical protein